MFFTFSSYPQSGGFSKPSYRGENPYSIQLTLPSTLGYYLCSADQSGFQDEWFLAFYWPCCFQARTLLVSAGFFYDQAKTKRHHEGAVSMLGLLYPSGGQLND